jgi:hypothetical protein
MLCFTFFHPPLQVLACSCRVHVTQMGLRYGLLICGTTHWYLICSKLCVKGCSCMGGGLPGRTPLISFVRPTHGLEALCREVRKLYLGQYLIQSFWKTD